MRKTTSIELELFKNGDSGIKFYTKQFDDLKLKVKVFDGTEQVDVSNQDITVFILKEDKTVIEQKKDIVVDEDNTILIDLSKQSTTALGKCSMELSLKDDEGVASTSTVSYMVGEKLSASIVEMIKSEDDINALALIEEFIETSNVDILEIKEAIQEIRDYSINAESNLEEKYNKLIVSLNNHYNDLIENMKSEADRVLSGTDEAIKKAEDIIDNINSSLEVIEGIDEIVEGAINDINSSKMEIIGTINTKKEETISQIDEKGTEIVEEISKEGQVVSDLVEEALKSISSVDTKVEEGLTSIEDRKVRSISLIDETTETNIVDINNKGEEAKEGIANSSLLEVNKIHNAREEAIVKIDEKKAEVLSNIEGTKVGVIEELTSSISSLKEQAKSDLDKVLDEVIEEGALDINAIEAEIQSMKIDVENTLSSIIEKITEANTTYEELAELVEEAKRVIGLVRVFIEEQSIDLSLYYTKEEVDALFNNINLTNFYTKEETNNLIEEAIDGIEIPEVDLSPLATKEELEAKFKQKGVVGISSLPSCYTFAPTADNVTHEIWIKDKDNNCFIIQYTKANASYCNMYLGSSSSITLIAGDYITYKWNGENWIETTIASNTIYLPALSGNYSKESDLVQLIKDKHILYSTMLFRKSGYSSYYISEPIEKPSVDVLGDYNEISMKGIYRISHNEEISNAPVSTIEEGLLRVELIKDERNNLTTVYQEVRVVEGDIYTRVKNTDGIWTEWKLGGSNVDLSSYITVEQLEEAINGIDIPQVDISNLATKEELNTMKEDLESTIDDIEIPSIEGLASIKYVDEAISGIDLSDYATKEDLDNIEIPNIDLSSYSTTEEIKSLINESIGVVTATLIEDINTIIGGI